VAEQDQSVDLGKTNPSLPKFVSGGWDNKSMRTKLALALAVIGLLASSMAPASAVFGLSKCEKVKKTILTEEKISIILYDLTKKSRDSAIRDNSVTWGEFSTVYAKDILGRQSDIKVFDLMIKNSSCFSAEMNANIRTFKQNAQASIKQSQEIIDGIMKKSLSNIVYSKLLEALKTARWGFVSVYDKDFLKKMNG